MKTLLVNFDKLIDKDQDVELYEHLKGLNITCIVDDDFSESSKYKDFDKIYVLFDENHVNYESFVESVNSKDKNKIIIIIDTTALDDANVEDIDDLITAIIDYCSDAYVVDDNNDLLKFINYHGNLGI